MCKGGKEKHFILVCIANSCFISTMTLHNVVRSNECHLPLRLEKLSDESPIDAWEANAHPNSTAVCLYTSFHCKRKTKKRKSHQKIHKHAVNNLIFYIQLYRKTHSNFKFQVKENVVCSCQLLFDTHIIVVGYRLKPG